MTDCYICGHPILEGQKSRVQNFASNPCDQTEEFIVHANPADHLPTLASSGIYVASTGALAQITADAIKTKERECAAKLVEEFQKRTPRNQYGHAIDLNLNQFDDAVNALADRIRSGE